MKGYDEDVVGAVPNYTNDTIFHACLKKGKILSQLFDMFQHNLEIIVLFISKKGITMRADDRPLNKLSDKEQMSMELDIPLTGFSSWHYAVEGDDVSTPIPLNTTSLKKGLKGSVTAKESIILYIKRSDVKFLNIRVKQVGLASFKVDSKVLLIPSKNVEKLVSSKLNKPKYDLTKPTTNVSSKNFDYACKDANTSKVERIKLTIFKRGILISFGDNENKKQYPHGHIPPEEALYDAYFNDRRAFTSLTKCVKITDAFTIYATRGKPILFHIPVDSTGGMLDIYMVTSEEKDPRLDDEDASDASEE